MLEKISSRLFRYECLRRLIFIHPIPPYKWPYVTLMWFCSLISLPSLLTSNPRLTSLNSKGTNSTFNFWISLFRGEVTEKRKFPSTGKNTAMFVLKIETRVYFLPKRNVKKKSDKKVLLHLNLSQLHKLICDNSTIVGKIFRG